MSKIAALLVGIILSTSAVKAEDVKPIPSVVVSYRQNVLEPLRRSIWKTVFTDYVLSLSLNQEDTLALIDANSEESTDAYVASIEASIKTLENMIEQCGGKQLTDEEIASLAIEAGGVAETVVNK